MLSVSILFLSLAVMDTGFFPFDRRPETLVELRVNLSKWTAIVTRIFFFFVEEAGGERSQESRQPSPR